MKIRWTNKWSGETGYVKAVEESHFINSFDESEALSIRTQKEAEKVIIHLNQCGEGTNNIFDIVKKERNKRIVS